MTDANTAAIFVQGLKKSYKQLAVLRGVDFSVPRGATFALLGSNGAGKTTTVKILATLLAPDAGTVAVNGLDVVKQPQQVREAISLTGQNVTVDDILSGRENLRLIAKLRHLADPHEQTEQLLRRFDLLEAADRRISTYSGGMARRLDLALSLLGSPSVLFLDEPTSGLDPQARVKMWGIIKGLAQAGVTVFLTTQYLEEADYLADRIAILHEGKIVLQGSAAQLKRTLPQGRMEFRFADANALHEARELLTRNYAVTADAALLTLSVSTDGGLEQVSDLLNTLRGAGLDVVEFAQKLPTLEDVFLKTVNHKEAV